MKNFYTGTWWYNNKKSYNSVNKKNKLVNNSCGRNVSRKQTACVISEVMIINNSLTLDKNVKLLLTK